MKRRDFLRRTSTAAFGLGAAATLHRNTRPIRVAQAQEDGAAAPAPPSEKVRMGLIGCAGRGQYVMSRFLYYDDVEFVAVADVYDEHRAAAIDITDGAAEGYGDFRDLLDRDDIDAVVVATPPHWHPLATIMACEAGMDVYCEKPMCLTPAEGASMVKAARANGRVTQVGTQVHATDNYRRVVEVVRSGILGPISRVHTQLHLNKMPGGIGQTENEEPPAGMNWDMWCGPKPRVPFNWNLFRNGHHRFFETFIGSWLHEMGPHIVDLPVWALELPPPRRVTAMGGKYVLDDMSTIPDTMQVAWDYGDMLMVWSNMCANSHGMGMHREDPDNPFANGAIPYDPGARRLGVAFHGARGTLLAGYDWHELYSEGKRLEDAELPEPYLPVSPGHDREFLDCIKSRELPSCDVEKHYPLAVTLNLGQIAFDAGATLEYDADKRAITNNATAHAMLTPEYRDPWKLPV
jgi:predicted dehydrogenase